MEFSMFCAVLLFANYELTVADFCDISTGSGYNNVTDIHIIGFFPCTDPNDTRGIPVDNCDGIERIPIMKLALEEINERCDLLPRYRLVVDYANSACSVIPPVYHLIQQTDPSQPTKLMILGTGCSVSTRLMGIVAEKFLQIPQVAYTAGAPLFAEDKENYPRFYRMIPTVEQLADGYLALIDELHWKRVAILSHNDEFYFNVGLYTAEILTSHRVLTHVSFADDPRQAIKTIKELNARIIIAWIPYVMAVRVWCTVVKEKLVGADFVWFIPAWIQGDWWTAVDGTDCTAEEMSKALEHSLGVNGNENIVFDNDLFRVLISNKTVKQFKQDLDVKSASGMPKTDIFIGFGFIYDAMWTIALALNSSISILEERGLGRLEDFTYDSVEMADVFTEAVANMSFQGISGEISFQKNGNRKKPPLGVFQYRDGVQVTILLYNPMNTSAGGFTRLPGRSLMWQGGYIPKDGPVPEVQGDSPSEVIITIVITAFGILSTLYFFLFNIYYRNHVVVKRSSYRLNSLILAAVFVGFTGTLLFAIQLDSSVSRTKSTAICNIRYWMTELAFVLCFGTLFAKIWRLYKVFFNKNMSQRKCLKDYHMLILIGCIVTPTLLLLIIQAVFFPITLHTHAHVNEDNRAIDKIHYQCEGKYYLIIDVILFTGDITLGLLSVVLAYKTKKHLPEDRKYRKYHESAVINLTTMMALFLSTICEAIMILFLSNDIHNGILLIITLRECCWLYPVIFLLYIPKVFRIYFEMFEVRKKFEASQQSSRENNHTAVSFLSQKSGRLSNGTTTTFKWRRRLNKKYNPPQLVFSNSSNSSSVDSSRSDPPQQSIHKTIAFALDPNPAAQGGNLAAADNCVIFANVEIANKGEETTL